MNSHQLYHVKSDLFAALSVGMVLALPVTGSAGQDASADHDEVTFTKDIAPILQRSCQHCHQPDSAAPMSFHTSEDARPCALATKMRTGKGPVAGGMTPFLSANTT